MAYDPRQDVMEQVKHWFVAANENRPQITKIQWESKWEDFSESELYDLRDELKMMAEGE